MKKSHDQAETVKKAGWRLSGNEPYPCRVAHPRDLPGIHAESIAAGLAPGEKARYLLYAPVWEGGRRAPFGISAEPASHAIAVAHDRFLISQDSRVEGVAPALLTIPFADVVHLQLGSAFNLGWFAILFAECARAVHEPLLFRAVRRDRFTAAIREYRSSTAQCHSREPAHSEAAWDKVWGQDLAQAERIRELLVPGERPIGALHSSELWAKRRGFWRSKWNCVACEGLLLATDIGVFCVARETYDRPVTWNVGMNVTYAPRQAVPSAAIAQKVLFGKRVHYLELTLGRRDVTARLEVPFDESEVEKAEELARHLTGGESL